MQVVSFESNLKKLLSLKRDALSLHQLYSTVTGENFGFILKDILNLNHVKHLHEKTHQLKNILHEFEDLKSKFIEEKDLNDVEIQEKMNEIHQLKIVNTDLQDTVQKMEFKVKQAEVELYQRNKLS